MESWVMPQAVIIEIAAYIGTSVAYVEIAIAVIEVVAVLGSIAYSQDQQRKAQNEAKDAYNASLRDRYVMFRAATEPRQIVLGRCRVSGPMFFVNSYGAKREHLAFCVALAAHECEAIEDIYFNDLPVVIDGSGNINGVRLKDSFTGTTATGSLVLSEIPDNTTIIGVAIYGTTIVPLGITYAVGVNINYESARPGEAGVIEITYQPAVSPFINTEVGTKFDEFRTPGPFVTLSTSPAAGTLIGFYSIPSTEANAEDISTAFDPIRKTGGTDKEYVGYPPEANFVVINYQIGQNASKARVRKYLGAPGQLADAGLVSAFPTVWTDQHKAQGITYLVVELDYDPSAFPGGVPNVSAIVKGAKCFDPRTNTTAWSNNNALLAMYYATSPIGGRLNAALLDTTSFISAANDCDSIVNYVVNGKTYTRKLYTAGMNTKANSRPADVLDELIKNGTAGKWAFVNGQLRVRAGVYKPPVVTIDETWLSNSQQIEIQPRPARSSLINSAIAIFADEAQNYQVVQMPRVEPAVYVAEDGQVLPVNITMQCVQFTGQAQHVAACQLRDSRANATVRFAAKMRAYQIQIFDTINLDMSRFGWSGPPKTFEVIDVAWSIKGIELSLKATDSTILQLGAAFEAFDPIKATRLPSPWKVANVINLTAASGTAQLLRQADGTISSRILVTWDAILDAAVYSEGKIEIRYGLSRTSELIWESIEAQGSDIQLYIPNVQDGAAYTIIARAKNLLVTGQWCKPIINVVIGKTQPPVNVAGLLWTQNSKGGTISWTDDVEVDYDHTELRIGVDWLTGADLSIRAPNPFVWLGPVAGTYKVFAKHFDTSGNESAVANFINITITPEAALSWANITGKPSLFRVVTRGQLDTNGPALAGLYVGDAGTGVSVSAVGGTRSYVVHVIRRSDGAVLSSTSYDVFIDPANANALAAQLNGLGTDVIVVVRGEHEPQTNRTSAAMLAAMLRCGASRAVFGSPQFKFRSAFVLVGIPGSGEGNGYESYSGSVDNDSNAWCDVAFTIYSGNLLITGSGATPRTLADYSYTGSLNATNDIRLIGRGVTVAGNNLTKVGGINAWDSDAYSIDSYVGGAFASGFAVSTSSDLMFGLNSDPTADSSYTSLDYAWRLSSTGQLEIWENGSNVASPGAYSVGDVMAVIYDGAKVQYLQNGVVKRTVVAAENLKLSFDSSFAIPNSSLTSARFGPLSSVTGIGTSQILPGATVQAPPPLRVSSIVVAGRSGTGSSYSSTGRWTLVGTHSFTADVSAPAFVNVSFIAQFSGTPTIYSDKLGCQVVLNIDYDNNGVVAIGDQFVGDLMYAPTPAGVSINAQRQINVQRQFDVISGVKYTWPVYAQGLEGSLQFADFELSVQVLKR
jgi:hypothetical protein